MRGWGTGGGGKEGQERRVKGIEVDSDEVITLPSIAELGRPDCSPEYVDAFALSEEQSRINNAEEIHLFFALGTT